MTNRYGKLLAEVTTSTTVAQAVDLLSSVFQQVRADSKIRLTIVVNAAIKVQLWDVGNGVGYYLNGGAALVADSIHSEEFTLDTTRTWNIQTDDLGGMTCNLLAIVEVDR